MIGTGITQANTRKLQRRYRTISGKDEVIMVKLDRAWGKRSRHRRRYGLVKKRRVADRLHLQPQRGSIIWHAKNTRVKVNHVDLVNSAEETLGEHVALRIRAGAERGTARAASCSFAGVANIARHGPTRNRPDLTKWPGLEIAVTQR